MTSQIFLSRKNLLVLLSKLDRQLAGEKTECTIIKYKAGSPSYQQTMQECKVTAVENKEYYEALERHAGIMFEADEIASHKDKSSY